MTFQANGCTYNFGYYLADGIYPRWGTFVKPISKPQGKKELYFHNAQAAARKDVERAFGILQAEFAIVRGAARFWDKDIMCYIMAACVILHNMILGIPVQPSWRQDRLSRFLEVYNEIRDADTDQDLQKDVMGGVVGTA